jgi:hypothetical protein
MTVACFWLAETGSARVGLRRYSSSECPRPGGYHDWTVYLGEAPLPRVLDGARSHWGRALYDYPGRYDPRWPASCPCGYQLSRDDHWQEWQEALYQRGDAGELTTIQDAPDGAMWDAWWMPEEFRGPDGRSLAVKCPGGHVWMIDSRASNCPLPGQVRAAAAEHGEGSSEHQAAQAQDEAHRCWVRHGEPPAITVDKDGTTCAAGAGSIQAGNYHGFLRSGVFT